MIRLKRGNVYRALDGFTLALFVIMVILILFLRPAIGETQTLVNQELETASKLDNSVSLDYFASQVSVDTATIRSRFQKRPGAPKTSDFSQVVFCSIHQVYEAKVDFSLGQKPRPAFYDPLGLSDQSSVGAGTAYDP